MTIIRNQVMDVINFAEFVMAKERKDRIGSSEAVVYPMKFCFHGQEEIIDLMAAPFCHSGLEEKDALAPSKRVLVSAMEARAVLWRQPMARLPYSDCLSRRTPA